MLERVFFNWPVAVLLEPDEVRRLKTRYFYAVTVRLLLKYGEGYAPSPKIEGVAIWVHSDYNEFSTWQLIKSGTLKAVRKVGVKAFKRIYPWLEFVEKHNSELTKTPHYHFAWLGVEPKHQKKGIGTELIHALLNKCSKENMQCTLDTQEKINVDYYKRFGFKVIKECQYPNADITYWGMLWEPEK